MQSAKHRLATAFFVLAAASFSAKAADLMSVQVKQTQLRETPAYIGKIIAALNYGDSVTVLDKKPGWLKVSSQGGIAGWVNQSALTSGKLALSAGAGGSKMGADDNEIATAGKGFNAQVESEFKNKHKNVDFTWVDKMEQITITHDRRREFLFEGRVAPTDGGAP